eukprot:CAMPEP_0176245720 /NCGR_PEP_ID=MMETSP0121_2-20121125/32084_1 /TAXON_ID=160619 /ORGANISM="Kryptoperidinium foliaceum, Strain CCMP 1326" /LENGTH=258 /DNA_ID=CAMNT_0017585351 /DNA_START=83 /DNA_END=856 /DNA_ORIENTATION=-
MVAKPTLLSGVEVQASWPAGCSWRRCATLLALGLAVAESRSICTDGVAQDDIETAICQEALPDDAMKSIEAAESGAAQLQLLQSAHMLHKAAATAEQAVAVADAKLKQRGCPTDLLVGKWVCADALATGKPATLEILPSNGDCDGLTANFDIIGATGVYTVTNIERFVANEDALLKKRNAIVKVKFQEVHGKYFHEGLYDVSADTLVEDLAHVNGNYVGGGILEFQGSEQTVPSYTAEAAEQTIRGYSREARDCVATG